MKKNLLLYMRRAVHFHYLSVTHCVGLSSCWQGAFDSLSHLCIGERQMQLTTDLAIYRPTDVATTTAVAACNTRATNQIKVYCQSCKVPARFGFWVSQFFCSCSYHLEFPSLGYSKQFYHILFSPPTQNLLLESSFLASLVPHPTPAQRLRFGGSTADIVRFTNSFTYLLTYLLTYLNDIKHQSNTTMTRAQGKNMHL